MIYSTRLVIAVLNSDPARTTCRCSRPPSATSAPPTAWLAASLHQVQAYLRTLAMTDAEISTLQVVAK
jgi:hypothetical protein